MSDQRIIDKLVTGRIALLLKHPFFGNLATRLKLVNADEWCPTAGTDGRHFFFNTKFIDSLTPKETELVVMGAKIALTNYKLPFDPSKLKSFDRFHKKFGKYVITAMESK